MSLIVTADLIELTKIGLNEVYLNEANAPGQMYQELFDVQDSDKSIEEELRLAGFGLIPPWNSDGGRINYDKPISGARILFTHTDFALGWVVSHKMLREDLYKKTGKELTTCAGLSTRHSVETDALNIFNLGFSDVGPDGVSLFDGVHPLLGGGTQSNLLAAAALTEGALQTALGVVKRAKNDRSQPITYELDYILVPPEYDYVARKLLNPTDRPEPGTGGAAGSVAPMQNVFKGAIPRILVSPYLTGTNVYFIGAIKAQRFMKFFWRERPWYDADKDFETKGVANSVAYAYSVGYSHYGGMWGSLGA